MHIKSFVFNPFYENTYVIWGDDLEAFIIDPGCYESFENQELINFVIENDLKIKAVVNTHCHIDHVLGNFAMTNHFNCPLWIPENEDESYRSVTTYAPTWGIQNYTEKSPDLLIKEGDELTLGDIKLNVIEIPGHSPGHQVFYHEPGQQIIGGDVLFRESIGRTDLPGGDHATLLTGIQEKLYSLPEDCTVYPGHGPSTTIGHEKIHNPFVKA